MGVNSALGYGKPLPETVKFYNGTLLADSQLTAATPVSASGSFIDVSNADFIHVLARWGAIVGGDAPTLEPRISDVINGTLDVINPLHDITQTFDATSDGIFGYWMINGRDLPEGHTFLSILPGGTINAGTHADIFVMVGEITGPVVQDEAVLAKANQMSLSANQLYTPPA